MVFAPFLLCAASGAALWNARVSSWLDALLGSRDQAQD
jgi:hypothetical protein